MFTFTFTFAENAPPGARRIEQTLPLERKVHTMNDYFGFCITWPDEVKEAWSKQNKLACRYRCLEAQLDRIDYAEFESLFNELEKVQRDLLDARQSFEQLQRLHCSSDLPGARA